MSASNVLDNIFISSSLVEPCLDTTTDLESLEQLSSLLLANTMVKPSFTQAVKNRELEYPTGLPFESIGVAIPHTDSEHVITQSLAIGILKNPVKFRVMGGDLEDYVEVQIIFMLAIKEAHQQLQFLQALMNLLQDNKQLSNLLTLSDSEKIISHFKQMLTKN